jgi:hypothetical protein
MGAGKPISESKKVATALPQSEAAVPTPTIIISQPQTVSQTLSQTAPQNMSPRSMGLLDMASLNAAPPHNYAQSVAAIQQQVFSTYGDFRYYSCIRLCVYYDFKHNYCSVSFRVLCCKLIYALLFACCNHFMLNYLCCNIFNINYLCCDIINFVFLKSY